MERLKTRRERETGANYGSLTTPDPVDLAGDLAGLAAEGIENKLFHVGVSDRNDIVTELFEAKAIVAVYIPIKFFPIPTNPGRSYLSESSSGKRQPTS